MSENQKAVDNGHEEIWWSPTVLYNCRSDEGESGEHPDDDADWGADRRQILLMRAGEPANEHLLSFGMDKRLLEWEKITHMVYSFLGILHSNHRVHRDVRLSNIMMFENMPQLIDYGFSCETNYGGDHPSTPLEMLRLRPDLERSRFKWTTELDFLLFQITQRKHLYQNLPTS